jgi:hypothetical protein
MDAMDQAPYLCWIPPTDLQLETKEPDLDIRGNLSDRIQEDNSLDEEGSGKILLIY